MTKPKPLLFREPNLITGNWNHAIQWMKFSQQSKYVLHAKNQSTIRSHLQEFIFHHIIYANQLPYICNQISRTISAWLKKFNTASRIVPMNGVPALKSTKKYFLSLTTDNQTYYWILQLYLYTFFSCRVWMNTSLSSNIDILITVFTVMIMIY